MPEPMEGQRASSQLREPYGDNSNDGMRRPTNREEGLHEPVEAQRAARQLLEKCECNFNDEMLVPTIPEEDLHEPIPEEDQCREVHGNEPEDGHASAARLAAWWSEGAPAKDGCILTDECRSRAAQVILDACQRLRPIDIELQVVGVAIEVVVRYPKGQAKQWGQVSKAVQPLAKQLACDLGFAEAEVFGEAR
mmetsp:Transcript_23950/g.75594  ORF Transcript_23950/g.75594 Transcript_23950/m.75594 type:complete len:193 (-) Transcript_23950:99-677(-)